MHELINREGDKMGKEWSTVTFNNTRQEYREILENKFETFENHRYHTEWSKKQMRKLKKHLPKNAIIIKCDFIENIAHERGAATSQSHFGKRQTQFLSVVLWHWVTDAATGKVEVFFSIISAFLQLISTNIY
jgi:hypothetical protein